jgi:16S rRNA G966 N2-methylase RsmD
MRVIAGTAKGHSLKTPKSMSTRPMADKVKGAVFSMLSNLLAQSGREWGKVLDLYSGTGSIGIEALSRGAEWADFVEINAGVCRIISENLEHTHLVDKGRVNNRTVQNFLSSPSPAPKNKVRAQGGLQWRKGGSLTERKARREMLAQVPEVSPNGADNNQTAPTNDTGLKETEKLVQNYQEQSGETGEVAQATWQYDIIFLDPPYADPKISDTLKHVARSNLLKDGGLVVVGHSPRVTLAEKFTETETSGQALNLLRFRRHGDSAFSIYIAGNPVDYGFGDEAEVDGDTSEAILE